MPAGALSTTFTSTGAVTTGATSSAGTVVCGAYSVKANAEGVKQALVNEGYTAMVVYNAERNLLAVLQAAGLIYLYFI